MPAVDDDGEYNLRRAAAERAKAARAPNAEARALHDKMADLFEDRARTTQRALKRNR